MENDPLFSFKPDPEHQENPTPFVRAAETRAGK